jgi:energy-coupling factor transporter ATP-binding protein EcfA2
VAIARAIAGNRPVLLADEPTGNLDIASGKEVMALFHELCHDEKNPISILMVTHDPDLASNADRMLLLKNGKTEASDIRSAWGLDAAEPDAAEPAEDDPASESPSEVSADASAGEAVTDDGQVDEPAVGGAPATDGGEEE